MSLSPRPWKQPKDILIDANGDPVPCNDETVTHMIACVNAIADMERIVLSGDLKLRERKEGWYADDAHGTTLLEAIEHLVEYVW